MNFILNLLFILVTGAFVGLYLYNIIINVIRGTKSLKAIKANPAYVEGVVSKIVMDRNTEFVKVDFVSKKNGVKFSEVFQFNAKQVGETYKEGDNVKIFYEDCSNKDKVTNFPLYLEGEKISYQWSPTITDLLIFGLGVYLFVYSLILVLTKDETFGVTGLTWGYARPFIDFTVSFDTYKNGTPLPVFNFLYIFLYIMMYIMSFSFVQERLKGLSSESATQYLKFYGTKGAAEVKTYKFTKQKNNQGIKESEVKIEFRTNSGELIQTTIYSFLYTQSEEQFITILYDENNPKNVVYMKENAE